MNGSSVEEAVDLLKDPSWTLAGASLDEELNQLCEGLGVLERSLPVGLAFLREEEPRLHQIIQRLSEITLEIKCLLTSGEAFTIKAKRIKPNVDVDVRNAITTVTQAIVAVLKKLGMTPGTDFQPDHITRNWETWKRNETTPPTAISS